jgi:YHS domain-containing protein
MRRRKVQLLTVIDAIGRSVGEGWWMFFDTFWALVLGFGLSGAVQAFVSRAEMQHALGTRGPKTLAKASFFGVVSSSCSYAASALAKSLFARGADFTAAMVFMIASTNLVVELGIVLWLLIGWQFAAAEFVGGAIMIVLLGLVLPRVIPARWIDDAREDLNRGTGQPGAHEQHGGQDPALAGLPWRARVRSRAGWSEASGYTISDLTMLRKEMVAGFVIAGFATTLVPTWVWRSVFITGHGFWSSLENVILGPFIAIISFVCSIGNVPLGAALWKGGISFGGVVSFIFADLITLPLLVIYRKYFGTRLTLRLLAAFWVTMSIAGLATEYLFKAAHLVPDSRPTKVAGIHVGANYTTALNAVAVVAFAVIYWLYRRGRRDSDAQASRYAKDVVCGMQVEKTTAPAQTVHGGRAFYFCSDRCRDRFAANPGKYAAGGATEPMGDPSSEQASAAGPVDPVCQMSVQPTEQAARFSYAGREYLFCSAGCRDRFAEDPLSHLLVARDPVCGMDVQIASAPAGASNAGGRYVFCGSGCRDAFVADPSRYLEPASSGSTARGS